MGDSSRSIPEDAEIELVRTSKKNIEWLEEKLKEPDNLKKKGKDSIENLYGETSHGHTIFKYECKANGRDSLEPRVVAIGPYHRNCKNCWSQLKLDDDFKLEITRFMVNYCRLDANKYLREMVEKEEAVRSCYDKDLSIWSSEEFRTMLLLDSSFILFVMDGFSMMDLERISPYAEYMALYLDVMEHSEQIKVDLLTVDNQVPFSAIKLLLGCFPEDCICVESSIEELAWLCFRDIWPYTENIEQVISLLPPSPYQFHHLLHLFHWSRKPKEGYEMGLEWRDRKYVFRKYIHNAMKQDIKYYLKKYIPNTTERGRKYDAFKKYIPSATELQKSATKFKRKYSGSCLDVTFNRGVTMVSGVINIPELKLYDYSEPIFRNLIAYEATPINGVRCFTAYTACMSRLLQHKDDVKLLRERRMVASTNYTDAGVVKFFAELNREIKHTEMPDTLQILYTNVTNHHDNRISKWWGSFMLQYCPNFWVALSLIAGIVIFSLTLLQTLYVVLTYYVEKKKK